MIEIKRFGSKGDPSFQLAACYLKFWLSSQRRNIARKSNCPTFFIQVVENLIWISCAVLVDDHCVVEPVAFLPCFCLKYDRQRFYNPVARAFACLRDCLSKLDEQYKKQVSSQLDKKFPAITSCKKFKFK